jgi:serine/threonine protein kinase
MAAQLTRTGLLVAGRFQLERELGRGAAATVWRARDLDDGRAVAVKLFDPEYLEVPQARLRIEREARVLAELSHPNIARAIDLGVESERPYVVIELVEGSTLEDVMIDRAGSKRGFEPREIAAIMRQLTAAISHAHEHRIVHRDLKPSNVMLVQSAGAPRVKVLDFGVAKLLDLDSQAATTQGRFIGTLIYMSPEQLLAEDVDEGVDVFAVGAILFELLTLRRTWVLDAKGHPAPFAEPIERGRPNSFGEVIDRITRAERPRPSDFTDTTPALDDVVATALACQRSERYPSVRALAAALEPALDEWADAHADTAARPPHLDVGPEPTWATIPESTQATRPDGTGATGATIPEVTRATIPEATRATIPELIHPDALPDTALPAGALPDTAIPHTSTREEARADLQRAWESRETAVRPADFHRRPLLGAIVFLLIATLGTALAVRFTLPPPEARFVEAPSVEPIQDPAQESTQEPVATPATTPRIEARTAAPSERAVRPTTDVRPSTPPRDRKVRETPAPEEPRAPRPRPVLRELRDLLRRAEQDPALVADLARRIDRAAESVPDEKSRVRIRRIAASSALVGDLDGISQALDLLTEALR